MATKTVSVSSDNVTFYTLPGSSGDLSYDGMTSDDTIFGYSFKSTQPTLISWTASANSFYKGYAGYVAKFLKSGSTTAFTTEAMTLVSGKTYKITNAAKNVFDRTVAITVFDNAVDHTADVESIDHLFGRVTFKTAYTVTGPVTISGSYLPMASVGTARDFSLKMSADAIDTSDYATTQANGGYKTFSANGLRTVSLDASGFYALSNGFKALLASRGEVVVELNPDGASKSTARGFFRATKTGQSGNVGASEDETITFELSVPDQANVVTPFKWLHDSTTTLSTAVQKVLDAWQNQTTIYIKYLSDGVAGNSGQAVITDCSLSNKLDGVNEFSISAQGTGAPTVI